MARIARLVLWGLFLVMPVYTMAHLGRIYPTADIYQHCDKNNPVAYAACTEYPKQKKSGEPPDANPLRARVIAAQGSWFAQAMTHLRFRTPEQEWFFTQRDYTRHGFRYGDAHGPSYYPGLQGWIYALLVCWVLVKWLTLAAAVGRRRAPGNLWIPRAVKSSYRFFKNRLTGTKAA